VIAAAVSGVLSVGCEEVTPPPKPTPPPPAGFELYSLAGDDQHRLKSNDVYHVFVDSSDRIWFSTDQGVSMRDGNADMVNFDDFDGIPNRFCRSIGELNGRIYVGTWGGGAAVYDDTTWTPLPVDFSGDAGLVDLRVQSVISDGTSMWFGTINGLSRYLDGPGLTDDQRWSNHTNKMGSSRVISQLTFQAGTTRGDELWVSTKDGGITVIRNGGTSWTRYTAGTTGLRENDVTGTAYSPTNDVFWVSAATTGASTVDVDAATWSYLSTTDGLASNLAMGVAVRDMNGTEEMWLATQTGLSLVQPTKIVNYLKGSNLPSERLRCVTADKNGQIWACFIEEGVGRLTDY